MCHVSASYKGIFLTPCTYPTLSISPDTAGGHTWDYRLQVTDEYQYTDYSSLVGGKLMMGVEEFSHPVAGLLWGSCLHPIPMRVSHHSL